MTEESLTIPEALRFYIDWEAVARDARLNGEAFTGRPPTTRSAFLVALDIG